MTCSNSTLVNSDARRQLGWWIGHEEDIKSTEKDLRAAIDDINSPLFVVGHSNQLKFVSRGNLSFDLANKPSENALPFYGYAAPTSLENLGDASFCKDHGIKYAYIGGSMAHGIASPEIAIALGKAGMLGFIGSVIIAKYLGGNKL